MSDMELNIPGTTVEKVISLLKIVIGEAIEDRIPMKELTTPFLWGAPGIGKSQAIYQLAEKLEKEYDVKVNITDVRLLLFSPIDLRGVPVADTEHKLANWLKPRIFEMDPSRGVINLLFLDELSAAPQQVQAAAYQLCLDRKIGEHSLPDNCFVIAAGNRVTDMSVSYKMPKALCNRLMHFNVKADFASWKKWAVKNGISEMVIAFIGMDESRLCVEPESSDLAYPTPRSWQYVSRILRNQSIITSEKQMLIAACVGNDTAIEFCAFCKGCLSIPSVNDIMNGRCREYPKTHDVMYALTQGLVSAMRDKKNSITPQNITNVCDYVFRFPKDFAVVFVRDVLLIEGLSEKLMKCYTFQTWVTRNKDSISDIYSAGGGI